MSTPGVSQCRDYTSGYCVWAQASGWPCRTLALRCLLLPTQHSGGACLSSPIPSWDCSEELKGCSKGLRFLSLFLANVDERGLVLCAFYNSLDCRHPEPQIPAWCTSVQMAAGAGVALLLLNPSADSQYSCSPGIRNFFSFFGFNFINNLQTIFFFWA